MQPARTNPMAKRLRQMDDDATEVMTRGYGADAMGCFVSRAVTN